MTDFLAIFSNIATLMTSITGDPMILFLVIAGFVGFFIMANRGGLPLALAIFIPLALLLSPNVLMGGGVRLYPIVPTWVVILLLGASAIVIIMAFKKGIK